MKIHLICPPILFAPDRHDPEPLLPLGIAILAASLKKHNYEVSICDINILMRTHENAPIGNIFPRSIKQSLLAKIISYIKTGKNNDANITKIIDFTLEQLQPSKNDIIALSILDRAQFLWGLFIARVCQEKGLCVVFGGAYMTMIGYLYLSEYECIRYFIKGFGENSLIRFIQHRQGSLPIDKVPNLHYTIDEQQHFTFDETTAYDQSPEPDYSLFNLEHYTINPHNEQSQAFLAIPYQMSRGCINHCAFCNDHTLHPFSHKSITTVISELSHIVNTTPVTSVMFNDCNVFFSYSFLDQLCNALLTHKIKIQWGGMTGIVDQSGKIMDNALITKLRKSGCHYLHFAPETGSNELRSKMGKTFTSQQIANILQQCSTVGIKTIVNFIHGYPYQNKSHTDETIAFIKQNRRHIDNAQIVSFYIAHNSAIHLQPQKFDISIQGKTTNFYKPSYSFTEDKRPSKDRTLLERDKQRLEKCIYKNITQKTFSQCKHLPYTLFKIILNIRHQNSWISVFIRYLNKRINNKTLRTYVHPYSYKYKQN